MADGGAGSCLSDLSDDLLRHILSFASVSASAATAVLSRRWLRLWRTSGDVYLDSRSFIGRRSCQDDEREDVVHAAEKALAVAAAHGPVRRLTFSIAKGSKIGRQSADELIDAVVSNPAARRVEELQIVVKPSNTRCTVSFGSLPSEALRELCLVNFSKLTVPPPGAAAFPMLEGLYLKQCSISLTHLQTIIDAAPQLTTLHLESSSVNLESMIIDDDGNEQAVGRLFIPGVTDLVVADSGYWIDEDRLELDAPRLQYFTYRGHVQQTSSFSLNKQASSNMIRVDLELTYDHEGYGTFRNKFWKFIQYFKTTKRLNLKLMDNFFAMDDFALEDNAIRDELLGGLSFDLLEQLELEAQYNYKPGFESSMLMLANLLHCCPVVRDLRLRFSKRHEICWMESSIDKEARLHFDKSVNVFRNRRRKSIDSVGGQNVINHRAFSIHGLTGEHSFSCLQSHLQRVRLQFFMDEPNCLEVQLAKFFYMNAMVLKEMHIDDGSQEMLEHVNSSLRRWIANTHNSNNQMNVKD